MSQDFGFSYVNKHSEEDQALIDAYLNRGGTVQECPPANAASNEAVRATNELVAKQRKLFREKRKAKGSAAQFAGKL